MLRRARRVAIIVVPLVIVAIVVLVLTARPRLESDRDRVDERWAPLREPLVGRYDALANVLAAIDGAGGGDRDVARELTDELDEWNALAERSGANVDVTAEVETANRLEGLSARVRANVTGSRLLSGVPAITDSLNQFAATAPPVPEARAYNDAAEEYQKARQSLTRSLVASVFDYDARPSLVLAGP